MAPMNVSPIRPGPDQRVNVSHVYVVVDASASVAEQFPGVKALTQSFVGGMPDGSYEVAAVSFGGYKRQSEDLRPFDRAHLRQGADNLMHLGEGTPLDRVLGELKPATEGEFGRGLVIVFSDGVPTDPVGRDLDQEAVISAAKKLREGWTGDLCFHTVQVGNDPEGAAFLKRLSEATSCGSARSAGSIQNVAALQNFEREIFLGQAASVAAAPGDADGDGIPDNLDQCPGTPKGVTPDGRGCWVVPGLRFAFDKTEIKPRYYEGLSEMVRVLRENPGMRVRLDGHTDSIGSEQYNEGLSKRRADAVKSYLVGQGIAASRITTAGFGESRPAYTNDTDEGRAGNRRTEITALER
jgi:OOP family OmpA-OmpF porin